MFMSPSCDINLNVVRALWACTLLVQFLAMMMAVFYLVDVARKYRGQYRKIIFGLVCLTEGVCMTTTCALRVSQPESMIIGTNVAISVLFGLGAFSFWIHVLLFTSNFVRLSINQARMKSERARERIDDLERRASRIFPVLILLDAIACVMPVAMTAASSRTTVFILALIHYFFLAVLIGILGIWLLPRIVKPLIADLEEAASHLNGGSSEYANVFAQIAKKLKLFQTDVRTQALANFLFAALFGGWPMLQSFTSYWLPIAWSSAGFILLGSLHADRPVK